MDQYDKGKIISIVGIVSIVRKWLWCILLCLFGVLAPIIYYNYTASPVYVAKTSIIFEDNAKSIQPIVISDVFARKSFIINQIEVIKSNTLAKDVVDALPYEIKKTFFKPRFDTDEHSGWLDIVLKVIPLKITKQSSKLQIKESEIERLLISNVRNSIVAKQVQDSDMINITVSAHSPETAKVMANTVTDVLKKRGIEVKKEQIRTTRQYINDQLIAFQNELEKAERALKEFKDVNLITELQEQGRELLRRVTEVDVLYNRAKSEREGVVQRLSYLEQKLSESKKTIVPDITQSPTTYISELQTSLVKIEVEKINLLVQEYPEDHPKVQTLQRQIEDIKEKLRAAAAQIADGASLVNPVSQMGEWVRELVTRRAELASLQAQESTLKRSVDEYERNLQTLPKKELQLAQLMRVQKVSEQIYLMLRQRYEEARITEAGELGNIRVVDQAELPIEPVSPRKMLNLIMGIIVSLTVGIGLAFLFESLDTSLKTTEEVETSTGLSVLGLVPIRNGRIHRNKNADGSQFADDLVVYHKPKSPEAESYRSLLTNLKFATTDGELKSLLVSSAGPEEGKSYTVANLGITMARSGIHTLLIDADLRRSKLHRLFGMKVEPGLVNVLKGEKTPAEVIRATGIDYLDLIPRGTYEGTPSELFRSNRMKILLDSLKEQYDMILLDSPPIIAVTDAVVLSAEVDGICLVVMAGQTRTDALLRVKVQLDNAKAKLIGLVLNKFDVRNTYGYSHYYYYHYYHNYYDHDGKRS